MVVEANKRVRIETSEFLAVCNCEDFYRHSGYEQTVEEFRSRKGRSLDLTIPYEPIVRYGLVEVPVQSRDRRGVREYRVTLSRGDGDRWVCKHILRALRSRALMPEMKHKTVVVDMEVARNLARMYAGRLRKVGEPVSVMTTTVNGCYVIGWWNVRAAN